MYAASSEGSGIVPRVLITNFTGLYADDYLEEICRSLPDKKILASGQGIKNVQRNFVNLRLLKTDQEIRDFVSSL